MSESASVAAEMSAETVDCYVCGSNDSSLWAKENGWDARRCASCGLVYVNPRPRLEAISRAAEIGMHDGDEKLEVVGEYRRQKIKPYRRRLGELYGPGYLAGKRGRWLDIGCGYGEFLEALAAESGGALSLVGSEPNETKSASARARGLDVTFLDLDTLDGPFDFVSLLNVYSHLPDPLRFLKRIRSLLAADGELLLQTGNWAELERDEIPDLLRLPDHLSFASERLINSVLEQAGFRVVTLRRFDMFPTTRWLAKRATALFGRSAPRGPNDLWVRARA